MIQLDDYQETSRDWLVNHSYTILGDEPGVGKTHPSIFAAKDYFGVKLVVCPAYLATNWQVELERCDITDVSVITGSTKEKQATWYKPNAHWFIMSYELFARPDWRYSISQREPQVMIFDEAHHLRGRNSNRTKAAFGVRKFAPVIWMLTGTPLVANGGDVWTLLHIIDPKKFSSYWRFVEDHCRVSHTPWATKIGNPKDKEAFNKLLEPYMLRRKLSDIFPEIPEVIETVITVDLERREQYKTAKKDYLRENSDGKLVRLTAGGLITSLRNMTLEAKLKALIGLVEDIPEDESIVVFAWYRESVQQAQSSLANSGYYSVAIDGSLSTADRGDLVQEFQERKIRILVATLSTMQEGVNLQVARHVIFLEEHWVAATNEQAVARLRRRGQTETVLKYVILTQKTVDSSIHKVQAKRSEMALESVIEEIWREEDGNSW